MGEGRFDGSLKFFASHRSKVPYLHKLSQQGTADTHQVLYICTYAAVMIAERCRMHL